MAQTQEGNEAKDPQIDFKQLEHLSILVAEDVAMNRFMIRQLLERKGIKVSFAENGQEALNTLYRNTFDLVLMDLHMPLMDGETATRAIRAASSRVLQPDIPIIALSADAFEHTIKLVEEAGMNGFVAKPIEAMQLFTTILKVV